MNKKLTAAFCAAALLATGCSKIEYPEYTGDGYYLPTTTAAEVTDESGNTVTTSGAETAAESTKITYSEHVSPEPVISETSCNNIYQLEFNSDAFVYSTGLNGFNGDGFVQLGNFVYTSLTVTVPASQHYKLGLRVCTTGCTVAVVVNGENVVTGYDGYETLDGELVGAFYVGNSNSFEYTYLDGIYLNAGENKITLQGLSGTAYIDELSVENGSTMYENCYTVSGSSVNRGSNRKTIGVMKYLADIYGSKTLTGQYCTGGTNTELYAVAAETGRYPAIRCGDLGIYTEYYTGENRGDMTELETAVKWSESGGLVSYSWLWYAPTTDSDYLAEMTSFDLSAVVTDSDIAHMDLDEIKAMCEKNELTSECWRLVCDIDKIAERLDYLQDNNVTVLFRPLPEAGNAWYWWGEDASSCKWLWKLLYTRMTEYHYLNNLIWVWNGESYAYYPGDDYVDILSEDIYNTTGISGNTRMMNTVCYSIRTKAAALSECAVVPSPDVLLRDNAHWLWFALWRGDYIINSDGTLSEQYTSREQLDYAYNHALFVTLDELPDFEEYAISG